MKLVELNLSNLKNVLLDYAKFKLAIPEFIEFVKKILDKFENANPEIKKKYATRIMYLITDGSDIISTKAKLNAYYAFLVFRGYVSAYRLVKEDVVPGYGSIYEWLKMYRELTGNHYELKVRT